MHLPALAPLIGSFVVACGLVSTPSSTPDIVRGEVPADVQRDERTFATVGLVTDEGVLFCSGTMIAEDMVLTAAHCLDGAPYTFSIAHGRDLTRRANNTYVKAGPWEMHREFLSTGGRLSSDVGLVRLRAPLAGARPARLHDGPLEVGAAVAIAGYGITSETGHDSGILRQAWTRVAALAGSGSAGRTEFVLSSGDGVDTCRYDSGGPVFIQDALGLALTGVTSWGEGCGQEGHYSDVRLFLDWIEATSEKLRRR